jgi:hypothetical protein
MNSKRLYLRVAYGICLAMVLRQVLLYYGVVRTFRGVYPDSFSIITFSISILGFVILAGADYLIHREDKKEKAKKKRTIRY